MTENPAATIDAETFTVERAIHIAAPMERVWSAVTDPANISQWFAPTTLDADGSGVIAFEENAVPLRVVSSNPQTAITYEWNNDDALAANPPVIDAGTSTAFTFTLEPVGDGTRLTVVETGFAATSDPAHNLASHQTGWTSELDKLVRLLETGAAA